MYKHFLPLIVIISFSCSNSEIENNQQVEEIDTPLLEEKPLSIPPLDRLESNENSINSDYPIIETLFITDTNGTKIYDQPNLESKTFGHLSYGSKIEIIEERDDWYIIKAYIARNANNDGGYVSKYNRNDSINGLPIRSWRYEKMWLPKIVVGDINTIKLISPLQYSNISAVDVNKHLMIQLIDENEFNSIKYSHEKGLNNYDSLVKITDTVLTISLTNNESIAFVSNPNDEETSSIYKYLGHIDSLNAFLLSVSYYEASECKLYSAIDGKLISTFIDMPYISPDYKNVISIYTNGYESTADFKNYVINSKTITEKLDIRFSHWMPSINPQAFKWIDNKTFALKVHYAKTFWNNEGRYNSNFQYLKIKIL